MAQAPQPEIILVLNSEDNLDRQYWIFSYGKKKYCLPVDYMYEHGDVTGITLRFDEIKHVETEQNKPGRYEDLITKSGGVSTEVQKAIEQSIQDNEGDPDFTIVVAKAPKRSSSPEARLATAAAEQPRLH